MILSSFNNQTATAALRRNGSARLALEAGGRSHRAALIGSWCVLTSSQLDVASSIAPISACKPVSIPAFGKSSVSIFGGSPFCATYATKQGLASNVVRMPLAPLTLDPGANQEGGA